VEYSATAKSKTCFLTRSSMHLFSWRQKDPQTNNNWRQLQLSQDKASQRKKPSVW